MNKILEMRFGSHLYGTQTENSDLDLKGVYLPTAREIILNTYKRTISTTRSKQHAERNTKDDIDIEIFSLDRYLDLLAQGQTVALDLTYGFNQNDIKTDLGNYIFSTITNNLDKIITKNVNSFVGYARQQAAKYGIKGSRMDALKRTLEKLNTFPERARLNEFHDELVKFVDTSKELLSLEKLPLINLISIPTINKGVYLLHLEVCGRKLPFTSTVKLAKQILTKIFNEYGERAKKAHLDGGVDWKALSHAVRVNNQAEELLLTHKITFPRPDAKLLLDIKTGQLPYEQVAELIETGLANLYTAHSKSTLRDTPDQNFIDNLIYEVYSKIVKDE